MYKLLFAAALSTAMMSSTALYAQTDGGATITNQTDATVDGGAGVETDGVTGSIGATGTLAADSRLGVFYTDDTFAELRADDEIVTMYQGLTAEEQASIMTECTELAADPGSPPVQSAAHLCELIGAL